MNTNTSLRIVVAMLLGTTMQGAFAYSPTDPIKFASESADITGVTSVAAVITAGFDVPVISGKVVSSTAPYFVVISLKDGATFGSGAALGMKLTCGYANFNLVSGAGTSTGLVTALTDSPAAVQGGTIAAFKLQSGGSTGGATGAAIGTCVGTSVTTLGKLTASKCTLSLPADAIQLASGKKDYGVSVVARHQDPSDGASATVNGTIVSFTQGMQLSVSAGSVTVDVTSPSLSKKFLVTGSVATTTAGLVTTAVAALGIIRYTPVPGVLTMAGGAAPTNASYLTTFNLTVSGSPIGAAQSTAAVGVVSGGIYLSNGNGASACNGSGAGAAGGAPNTLRVSSGNQVSFVAVPAAMLDVTYGLSVCMIGNEASIIDRGVVSFTIDGITGANGGTPNLSSVDSTLVKVVKNGTSIKVLNIPSPDYSVDQAYTRLYNMGTIAGKVFGTLYNPGDASNAGAGAVLGTQNAVLVESLAPNAVAVLTPADLARIFGLPSWNGRAWMQIESEIKGLRVQALMRNGPSGVLMNMGDRVLGDSECLTRESCANSPN